MIEQQFERIAIALERIAGMLAVGTLAPKPVDPATLPELPGEPIIKKTRVKKADKAIEAAKVEKEIAAEPVKASSDEIQLEGDDSEDDFLKEIGVPDVVVKPLELKDVRAELVKLQTNVAGGGNARVALRILKEVGGTEVLSKLAADKFQAVVDATRKAPEYPHG